ncbi:MAG: hypothetical protein NT175_12400 [Bacteroidetes bacterium]|nr:hypothetical protein [Bacteroidota bacterium]
MIKKVLRFSFKICLSFLLLLFCIFSVFYLLCPIYKFPQPGKFEGHRIYNPYEDMNPSQWKKANFQIQSRVWLGITNGRKNSSENIYAKYRLLGYDVVGISDYMKINRYGEGKQGYVPEYEHGYNIRKTHQVCIGTKKVFWIDYPLLQNLNHKQNIINRLRHDNELIFLAHPLFRHGYIPEDMKYLTNYDGIEVLNNQRVSIRHWDAALSAGHYVTIIGDDDGHDLTIPDEVGRRCTFINTGTANHDDIIAALKKGNAFGADINYVPGESYEVKIDRHKNLPVLSQIKMIGDTLVVAADKPASFRFIGQDGQIRKTESKSYSASYTLLPDDTYIRSEISFADGTTYYLNPVARYNDRIPTDQPKAVIDKTKTNIFRIIYLIIVISLVTLIFFRYTGRKK